MNKVNIVAVGKVKEKYFSEAISEYEKRLKRFCEFNIYSVKECNLSDRPNKSEKERILSVECEQILPKLKGVVYALCIEGKQYSSEDFAKLIEKEIDDGNEITFVIGSSYGLDERIKNMAKGKLSFSKMTFPHTLFRLLLTEQIYRAFMINGNSDYHK